MMKSIAALLLSIVIQSALAQGKFASAPWKTLIGKSCKSESEFPQLKEFVSQGGTLLSDIGDEEKKSVAVFAKGNTVIVLFEVMINDRTQILDVVEINNVLKTQEVKVGTCRDGANDMVGLVALVNQSKEERWKAAKAWYYNMDKVKVEVWPHASVTCLGIEGDD